MDSILVCRLSSLGDVVLTLPAVEALRARFPAARLDYVSREPYGRVLRDVRALDDLHLWSGPGSPLPEAVTAREWSLLVDLSGSGRSRRLLARVRAARRLRVSKEPVRRWAFVNLRPLGGAGVRLSRAVDRMFSCLAGLGVERDGRVPVLRAGPPDPDGPVVIAPGAGRATKRWPAERFAEVAGRLAAAGRATIVLGTPDEELLLRRVAEGAPAGRAEVIACADPGDLPAIVARGCAALTNDSGILHVAEACGLPVVALFGPTHPRLGFGPLRAESVALHTGIGCSPCDLHGPERCPRGHHRCLADLDPDTVYRAVAERIPAGAAA